MGWVISDKKRTKYREASNESRERKRLSLVGKGDQPIHEINVPNYNPIKTLKKVPSLGFSALSLFSGGGGLDLGFERAGFNHVASYDILDIAGETLRSNRPNWGVFSGEDGDVKSVDWGQYKNKVTVLHGGPPTWNWLGMLNLTNGFST